MQICFKHANCVLKKIFRDLEKILWYMCMCGYRKILLKNAKENNNKKFPAYIRNPEFEKIRDSFLNFHFFLNSTL